MENFDNLIFRASSCPKLMGARGIGKTGEKEAIKAYLAQFKGRTKEVKSKYLEKGIANELGAIELVNRVLGTNYVKNQVRLVDEFMTGECDCEGENEIVDIKCSWDITTFYEAMSDGGEDYEYQLRAYMRLWNKPKSKVIYCLTDMPETQLLKELEWAGRPYDGDLPDWMAIRIIKNYIYDIDNFHAFLEFAPINRKSVEMEIESFVHIPESERIISFEFERNEQREQLLITRIKEAREFLKKHFNKTA